MKTIRRSLRVLGLLLFCAHGVAICEAQTPPVRILPLGDSLTSGTSTEGAYRNKLHSLLTTAGYNVDFVGTQTDINNPTLPDGDHQGMGGYQIDQIRAGLPTWLNAIEDPDVVLLMIGTNDFSAGFNTATASNRLSGLVSDIAMKRPFAKIIVASLPVRTDDPNLETLQVEFNAAIPGIVSSQVAQGRQASFVDIHAAVPPADLSEGVHPTAAGYEKIAEAWLPAITSVIAPLGTSNPPAIARIEPPVDLQHIAIRFSKPVADSSTALANFSLDGGLTISQAVLDAATKRTITLTTSAQTAGKLYTLMVSGVRDRTAQQNLIAAGTSIKFSSLTLQNSNFESGATGWTFTGSQVVIDSPPPYVASSGTKLLVMNGGLTPPDAVISQTFPTIPGQFYTLEFDMGILAFDFSEQWLGVEAAGSSVLISQVESLVGNGLGNSVWSARRYSFTANSTTTTLTFRDLSTTTDNLDLLLDNVRVAAAPITLNTAPVAVADAYSTNLDTALVIPAAGVLGNDSDAQSNALTAVIDTNPAHGSVILNADGGFTYMPAAGYAGADSFTYHANDGLLNSNIVTVSITVNTVIPVELTNGSFESGQLAWTMTGSFLVYGSDGTYLATDGSKMVVMNAIQSPPSAVISQTFSTTPGQSYTLEFDVGILALNLNEQRLGVTLTTGATTLINQTESLFGNGQGNSVWTPKSYVFTAIGPTATLTFRDLSVSGDNLDLLLDNVRVTPSGPVNTAPVAVADSYSSNQNTALVVPAAGVLSNDTDAQSDPLTAVLNAGPAHGTLTLNSNGSFTYTPTTGYTGSDSFTYRANDGSLNSNTTTVSLTVNAVNTAPVAVNDSYSTNQGVALVVPATGVLTNDTDAQSNLLTAILSAGPSHGTLTLNPNGGFTYTPTAGYTGSDSFTYRANDGSLNSNIATVSLTINPGNTAPVAAADTYATYQETALAVAAPGVLANDTDAQSNPLTAVLSAGPIHGTLILNPNGSFSYSPAAGYTGPDSFTYRASDGSLNSNVATVSITVHAQPSSLVVNGSFESGYAGWTNSGNQTIGFYSTTDGIRQVVFNRQNSTPNGVLSQTFPTVAGQTYSISLDAGVLAYVKRHQKLRVTVTGATQLLSEMINLKGASEGIPQWTTRTFAFVADSNTTILTFEDRSNFTYGIDLLLDNVRVSLSPTTAVAVANSYSTNKNTPLAVAAAGVLANDTLPPTGVTTAVLGSGPAHGSVALAPDGGFTYTPANGYVGSDSFTYRASNNGTGSNVATVSITINDTDSGLLVNPSFESGFTGWTFSGNQEIEFYPTTDGTMLVAFNGHDLTPNATLSQGFATTPGKTYNLTFDISALAYMTSSQTLQVTATGSTTLLSGTATVNGSGNGLMPWLPQAFSFTADSNFTTLAFRDQSNATIGIDLLLDNVKVIASPVVTTVAQKPVPELAPPVISITPGTSVIRMDVIEPGEYLLERSEDLKTWELLGSVGSDSPETIEFYDSASSLVAEPARKRAFYRIGFKASPQAD
jgi:VCBS repeat-containing protein